MNKEKAIDFARLMESYLDIPSFMCENIESNLINEKYKDVIEYILLRRNELERNENYKSKQDIIKMYLELKEKYEFLIGMIKINTQVDLNKVIDYINKGDSNEREK